MHSEALCHQQQIKIAGLSKINSYWPTVSLISISGLLLHTIIIRAKRGLSSRSSTILSAAVTSTTSALVFHVRSFLFFIGDQRLTFQDWNPSFTKQPNSLLPISLFSHKSSFTLSGITTLVCVREWIREPFNSGYQLCYTFLFVCQDSCSEVVMMTLSLGRHPSHFLCLFS